MSGLLSEERLAAIEARVRATTPGPWWGCRDACHPADYTPESVVFAADWSAVCELATDDGLGDRDRANKDFIAESRQDIPDLLAEVRRLRNELAAAQVLADLVRRTTNYPVEFYAAMAAWDKAAQVLADLVRRTTNYPVEFYAALAAWDKAGKREESV